MRNERWQRGEDKRSAVFGAHKKEIALKITEI
jgi:hypothetical protein